MAIARPITKSIISTTAWGIPITDQVNANTTDIAALKPGGWISGASLFKNGWTNWGGGFINFQYRKSGDMCELVGMIKNAATFTATGETIFATLPVGYRPNAPLLLPCIFGGSDSWGGPGRMDVMNNGDLKLTYTPYLINPQTLSAFNTQFSLTPYV